MARSGGIWSTPVVDPATNTVFVAAGTRNSVDRNDISAGHVWQDQIAVGGTTPQGGAGSISPGVFDGKYLYYAGGNTTIGG